MMAALLLAAALTGCGGRAPSDAAASDYRDAPSGAEELHTDREQSGEYQLPASAKPLEDTPEPSAEPFVDRLMEEGVGWGLSYGESGAQPEGNASPEELAQYNAYFMGGDSEKVIYLTFDCGYENGNTEPILDALKAHNAPATFFVVGHFLETSPELVRRMVDEGHAVGNHTFHHYDIDTLDEVAFQEELRAVEDKFREVTGTELSPYYRPPEGKCGIKNLTMAKEQGYSTIFWSLAYVDWDTEKQPTHNEAINKLTGRIHPGAVVLLHNTSSTNGEVLDELLTKWEEMGYTFQPLSYMSDNALVNNTTM